ncbi:MAG: MBL fold metallo-hydrolase [Myxococcales bacterium]|nr:MBL fold metallo-hydrolase [Myxococcales bacterium]
MKVTFLGGADEIGASSTLVEVAGHRLLIDCGIRMAPRQGEILPWLALVEERGGLSAIIQTHAHLDHSGALPLAYDSFRVPIYLTPPTLSIITTLLSDALKIMEAGYKADGELPIYSAQMVEAMLAGVHTIPFARPLWLADDLCVTLFPAGHILGASSVFLESSEGSILITGDICVTDQYTVPGLVVPDIKPDVVVIESTYGNRTHSSRALEESRLISQIGEVIQRRGAVLIPAFAIGRAQEVILILAKAMESGQLPKAPIFVDGMVRQVCSIYASYPEYVSQFLRKRIKDHGNPFYSKNGSVTPVWNPKDRDKIARTRPCVIVSSSGMLSGGPSVFYAARLADDPSSLIALTGYQDEESPGRKLQDLAAAGGGTLQLGEQTLSLSCQVTSYGLSAHSDASQLLSEIEALGPKEIILVHGYSDAKAALTEKLKERKFNLIHTPKLGETINISPRTRIFSRPPNLQLDSDSPIDEVGRDHLAERLFARDSTSRVYTLQELMEAWGYAPEQQSEEERKRVLQLLAAKDSPFKNDGERRFLFRLRVKGKQVLTRKVAEAQSPVKRPAQITTDSPQATLDLLASRIPKEAGLYRKSVHTDTMSIDLSFYFPKVAATKYQEILQQIQQQTFWQLSICKQPHQEALIAAVQKHVPVSWKVLKRPSVRLTCSRVTVQVAQPGSLAEVEQTAQAFLAETGLQLEVVRGAGSGATPVHPPVNPFDTLALLRGVQSEADEQLQSSTAATMSDLLTPPERMEINAALGRLREAFAESPHKPLKLGLKQSPVPHIEVAFVSPEIGARYKDKLRTLSQELGWEIGIRLHPDEQRLKDLAKALLSDFHPIKEPSVRKERQTIEIRLQELPPHRQLRETASQFLELTGYHLELTP